MKCGKIEFNGDSNMNISQLVNLLNKSITEGDATERWRDIHAEFEAQNQFKASKSDKENSQKSQQKADDKEKRPDSRMNPQQLRDKEKQDKNQKKISDDVEEDDNPMAIFQSQIDQNLNSDEDDEEDAEDEAPAPGSTINKYKNIGEKPFNLANCNNYDKFVKIVNSFRASESIRNDKIVKKYWEKLTMAEKQAIYIFFDNLTKVSDAEKTENFHMPKTPQQIGVKIEPVGQPHTQRQQQQSSNATSRGSEIPQKTSTPSKPAIKNPVSVQPITVGESHARYISIERLLQEVK